MINCNRGYYFKEDDLQKSYPQKNYLNPLTVARTNKWQQFNLKIIGEINWGVDVYFINKEHKDDSNRVFKSDIGITEKGKNWSAADGMMIYPIKELLKNAYGITDETILNTKAKEHGYFCSSIRSVSFCLFLIVS